MILDNLFFHSSIINHQFYHWKLNSKKKPFFLTFWPQEANGGKGYDVIMEIMANVNLPVDLKVLAPKGRLVMIGARDKVEIEPWDIIARETCVTGVIIMMNTDKEWEDTVKELEKGMDGAHWISPVIEKEIALEHAAAVRIPKKRIVILAF